MNGVIAAGGDLVIRRMQDQTADYELIVAWRNSPHVREWWDPDDPPLTLAAARDDLGQYTGGSNPTVACIIEAAGKPVGFLQFYPWDGDQEYLTEVGVSVPAGSWGLDIFIGAHDRVGQGIGSQAVRLLSDHLFDERGATAVALITEAGNAHAQAAYARAGMRVEGAPFLDTDTRDGQRVESVLMIRDRPGGTADGR